MELSSLNPPTPPQVMAPQSSSSSNSPASRKRKRQLRNPEEVTTARQPSSVYKGVTRHRRSGRYEAHLWDKDWWNLNHNKKGRQVYLGAYDDEEEAAHTYDLAALKYWGPNTVLNFDLKTYLKELQEMQGLSRDEYIADLRRRSTGFSRGASQFRGVARHHQHGRWEARINFTSGSKYLYLGTYDTEEKAAEAYDLAALTHRGPNAVTNFPRSKYMERLQEERQIFMIQLTVPQPPDQDPHFASQFLQPQRNEQLLELLPLPQNLPDNLSYPEPPQAYTYVDCQTIESRSQVLPDEAICTVDDTEELTGTGDSVWNEFLVSNLDIVPEKSQQKLHFGDLFLDMGDLFDESSCEGSDSSLGTISGGNCGTDSGGSSHRGFDTSQIDLLTFEAHRVCP